LLKFVVIFELQSNICSATNGIVFTFLVNCVRVRIVDVDSDVCSGQSEKKYLCEQSVTKEQKFVRFVVPRYYVAGI
jgi:hypothetical protein